MTGITYFCTDKHGNTYSRYSVAHVKPRYLFATIYRPAGTTHAVTKANVSYSGTRPASWEPATRQVVEVRAYAGRCKVEPSFTFSIHEPQETLTPGGGA